MRNQLDELVQAYLALAALLECRVLSSSVRAELERFRDDLEKDIGLIQQTSGDMLASWPSYHARNDAARARSPIRRGCLLSPQMAYGSDGDIMFFRQGMARILSVSYDEALLYTRRLLLEARGYTVYSAFGFNESLFWCKQGGFDLFILGHSIPEQDKDALIKQFRGCCPAPIMSLHEPSEPKVALADYHTQPDPESVLSLLAELLRQPTAKSV